MTKHSRRCKERTMKSRIRNITKKRTVEKIPAIETENLFPTITIDDISTKNLRQRRIVSLQTLLELVSLTQDHCKRCIESNLKIVKETWTGIKGCFHLHCNFCKETKTISTDSEHNSLPVNLATVWGTIEGGGGYQSQFDYLKILDIPPMKFSCYQKYELLLHDQIESSTSEDITRNGKEELQLALKDPDTKYYGGIPGISVTCDGGWGKRSYGHSFKSLSGCAVIIGNKTGKILHVGVRNKYCHFCNISPNKTHRCFKNYDGTSSGMETDIVLQGFLKSRDNHGLYYNEMLADQDSSVYVTVQEAMQQKFGVMVDKINCVNHAVKNLKKKLYKMLNQTKLYTITSRKWLRDKISKMSIACKCAIKYHNENDSNWLSLRQDIINCPQHYAENHINCRSYFCKRSTVPALQDIQKDNKFWEDLLEAFTQLANLSQSLIKNKRTNQAEAFMSVLSKYIGGKRKNLYQRNQYQTRVYFAVKSYKNGSQSDRMTYKSTFTKSPSTVWRSQPFSRKWRPRVRTYKETVKQDGNAVLDYGHLARQEDMTAEVLKINCTTFLENRKIDHKMQERIMAETIGQSKNPLWFERRKYLLTASHVYKVIQKKVNSKVHNLVNSILHPRLSQTLNQNPNNHFADARSYGLYYENEARLCYENCNNVRIIESGIIVDVPNGILGASPDGLIGADGLLEIKCPFAARYYNTMNEAISDGAIPYLAEFGDTVQLVRNSSYYFQVITQLGISRRKFCDFLVYIPNATDGNKFYCERILPDNGLWELMKIELERFYKCCLLPEIVNSRIDRKMPVRGDDFAISKELQEVRKKLGSCVRVKRKCSETSEVPTTPNKKRRITKRKLDYNCV